MPWRFCGREKTPIGNSDHPALFHNHGRRIYAKAYTLISWRCVRHSEAVYRANSAETARPAPPEEGQRADDIRGGGGVGTARDNPSGTGGARWGPFRGPG